VYQQQGIGLEQRLSELQAQIDQLNLSLHLWRQKEDQLQPTERRLLQLTDRAKDVLDQWSTAGERHEQTLRQIETRLSGLSALETRVQHDASERIHDLERTIEHEWSSLRQLHEEPVKQLREQAASLAEVCVAAAANAQRSFERAEARMAVLELELHRQMAELARDVQTALAEMRPRTDRPAALSDGAGAWPLEGVMRLHNQLRQSAEPDEAGTSGDHSSAGEPGTALATTAAASVPDSTKILTERMNTLEQALSDGQAEIRAATERNDRARRNWWIAGAAMLLVAIIAGTIAWRSQRQAENAAARVVRAEQQTQSVRDAATVQISAARDDAANQVAAARETAQRAQVISDVLAAPDLIRFNLTGAGAATRLTAQMLWSRSRGFVFSGSRLPAPPAGSVYQVWLMTNGAPISAGVFTPDESGRITIATDNPPRVPRAVLDVTVTVEPSGGSEAPSGATVLTRTTPRATTQ
jgi:hypothetical protein